MCIRDSAFGELPIDSRQELIGEVGTDAESTDVRGPHGRPLLRQRVETPNSDQRVPPIFTAVNATTSIATGQNL